MKFNFKNKERPNLERPSYFSILEKYNYQVESGDILGGIIIGLERNYFLVDIGLLKVSFLSKSERNISSLQKKNIFKPNKKSLLNLYDKIEVLITFFIVNKLFFLSIKEIHYLSLWKRIVEINFINKNLLFYAKIKKLKKKGKLINFEGLNLFVLNYHLSKYYKKYKKQKVNSELLALKFLRITTNKNIILMHSRFASLKVQSYLIQIGMKKFGYITKIVKFGLFINIHGIKSLLHNSEISNKIIKNLKNFYQKGKKFQIKIVYYNIQEGRIALSTMK